MWTLRALVIAIAIAGAAARPSRALLGSSAAPGAARALKQSCDEYEDYSDGCSEYYRCRDGACVNVDDYGVCDDYESNDGCNSNNRCVRGRCDSLDDPSLCDDYDTPDGCSREYSCDTTVAECKVTDPEPVIVEVLVPTPSNPAPSNPAPSNPAPSIPAPTAIIASDGGRLPYTPASDSGDSGGLSTGAIVGIVIGVVAFIAAVGIGFFFYQRGGCGSGVASGLETNLPQGAMGADGYFSAAGGPTPTAAAPAGIAMSNSANA